MNDQAKLPREAWDLLAQSDALRSAIRCRLDHDDNSREDFGTERAILEDLAEEAEAKLERLKREHRIGG